MSTNSKSPYNIFKYSLKMRNILMFPECHNNPNKYLLYHLELFITSAYLTKLNKYLKQLWFKFSKKLETLNVLIQLRITRRILIFKLDLKIINSFKTFSLIFFSHGLFSSMGTKTLFAQIFHTDKDWKSLLSAMVGNKDCLSTGSALPNSFT